MKPSFIEIAEQARTTERAGQGVEASLLWNKAAKLAKKSDNSKWAESRADFCLNSRFLPERIA